LTQILFLFILHVQLVFYTNSDVFPRYSFFFKWYGFEESHLIRACGVRDAGEVAGREDVMTLARETAKKIMA